MIPETVEQRCWVHETANILNALPKRLHRSAKAALHEIHEAESRNDPRPIFDQFVKVSRDKYPKAADKLTKDRVLLTFYDFCAAHRTHLRTTKPIESTFATVKARTQVTQWAGTRPGGLVMSYKLVDAAQERWRTVNSPGWSPRPSSIKFKDGVRVDRRTNESRDAA